MPIHTVYVGAHAFDAETPRGFAGAAVDFLAAAFPDPPRLASRLALEPALAEEVHRRVSRRFEERAIGQVVQDLRIDFEDGYQPAGAPEDHDAQEDHDAERCAAAVVAARRAGTLPPGVGLRLRSTADSTHERSLATLERFGGGIVRGLGEWPAGFVVTLAKIDRVSEVTRLVDALERFESAHGLPAGVVPVELMAETPSSIIGPDGRVAAPAWLEAARGRCVGLHFGVYDYTASLCLPAHLQGPRHPSCDLARGLLQVALAGTGVELSDGSSRLVPRLEMPAREMDASIREVGAAVEHALERGIYRGWDMAPSHVVIRWLATTAFFLRALPSMNRRLAALAGARREDLEDAATVGALRGFFRRGLDCGLLTAEDLDGDASSVGQILGA